MASNIKGITVEIGGNTAPLNNALKDINKTSRDLQSELREVNKQLKLDPTNTTLLEQRQKLLAESVSNTKIKLDTLKEAEKQVQQQFQQGKVGEEQYRALQREVIKTEEQLKGLEKQAEQSNVTLSKISGTADKIGTSAGNVASKMAPATIAIAALGTASFEMGSDFIESQNKVEVAFKDSSKTVEDFSKTTLDNFGIAQGSALDMAALFGDMGTAMGLSTDEAANMSTSLVGLSGDLASFKNIGIDQAQDALKGIFTGEGESLKSLGVIMQDSTLKEYALAQGINKKYEDMTQAEKVQLRYNYVMEMTKNAQGDFARTSDGAANSMRVASESAKEAATSIGVMLAPIVASIAQYVSNLAKEFTGLSDGTKTTILVILGLVAAIAPIAGLISGICTIIGAVTGIMGLFTAATVAETAATEGAAVAQTGLNLAFLACPLTWIVLAIMAAVAAFIYFWNTSEGFRNFWIGLWETIKTVASVVIGGLVNFFTVTLPNAWNSLVAFFQGIPQWFSNLFNSIKIGIQNALNNIVIVFTNIWNAIKNTTSSIITAIVTLITTKFSGVISGVQMIFTGLSTYFTGIWEAIKTIFLGAILIIIDLVTGNFTKLKEDTANIFNKLKESFSMIWEGIKTIFSGALQIIVSVVQTEWNGIVTITTTLWNGIKDFFSSLWETIKTVAQSAWEGFKNIILQLCQGISTGVTDIWNGIISFFQNLPTTLYNLGVSIFTNLKNGIGSILDTLGTYITDGFNNAITFITSLPDKAMEWGKDFIQGLVDGIKSMIGEVETSIESVAEKIRSYIHFSVPDEGPLTDYESYMPDFMEGLSKGIEENKHKVVDSIKGLSTDISVKMQAIPNNIQMPTKEVASIKSYDNNRLMFNIENFNNYRKTDIKQVVEEAEFYRQTCNIGEG